MNATWQVSLEDISQLKQSLVSVFNNNNTFCTYLVETKQVRSSVGIIILRSSVLFWHPKKGFLLIFYLMVSLQLRIYAVFRKRDALAIIPQLSNSS